AGTAVFFCEQQPGEGDCPVWRGYQPFCAGECGEGDFPADGGEGLKVTDFREAWREAARLSPRRILLPEGNDARVLQAAAEANDMGVCRAEVMGDPDDVLRGWREAMGEAALPEVPVVPAGPAHPR